MQPAHERAAAQRPTQSWSLRGLGPSTPSIRTATKLFSPSSLAALAKSSSRSDGVAANPAQGIRNPMSQAYQSSEGGSHDFPPEGICPPT